jgi:hypothetical protein
LDRGRKIALNLDVHQAELPQHSKAESTHVIPELEEVEEIEDEDDDADVGDDGDEL